MLNQSQKTEWNPFPTQWIWAFIFVAELILFFVAQGLFGSWAYFLAGPLIVYNLSIYFFPYLYFFLFPVSTINNRFAIEWKQAVEKKFPKGTKVHLLLTENLSTPLFAFSHKNTIWILSSEQFLEPFTPDETEMIHTQLYHLWKHGVLFGATTWTALQKTLPLRLLRNPRGTELMFSCSQNDVISPAAWSRLCFKVFHWMSHDTWTSPPAFSPSLFFPTLTNYSAKSYSSLYRFLQNELIESIQQGDPFHESANSGSFIFNPDPFHRIDGSYGPGAGTAPADREN